MTELMEGEDLLRWAGWLQSAWPQAHAGASQQLSIPSHRRLLWFKRRLPRYATKFIEMCVVLCADHGPCVSGERAGLHVGCVRSEPGARCVVLGAVRRHLCIGVRAEALAGVWCELCAPWVPLLPCPAQRAAEVTLGPDLFTPHVRCPGCLVVLPLAACG